MSEKLCRHTIFIAFKVLIITVAFIIKGVELLPRQYSQDNAGTLILQKTSSLPALFLTTVQPGQIVFVDPTERPQGYIIRPTQIPAKDTLNFRSIAKNAQGRRNSGNPKPSGGHYEGVIIFPKDETENRRPLYNSKPYVHMLTQKHAEDENNVCSKTTKGEALLTEQVTEAEDEALTTRNAI